jgi:hypothetical protein
MNPETHKKCSSCKEVLLRSHFTNDKSKKDGKRSRCRKCQREWNKVNGQRKREAQRKYAAKPLSRFKKYKRSAAERGYLWSITFEDFMKYWKAPCSHCGSPIETIGLDRICSSKPYQLDNIEPCCATCNRIKSDMTTEDLYKHLEKIRKHVGGFVSASRKY